MKYKFILIAILSICVGDTSIRDIQYSIKENGIMVNIDYNAAITNDDIIGWKSDRGWLYLTLLGVKAPFNKIPITSASYPIKKILLDDFEKSTQLAFLIDKPILGFDIINSDYQPNTIIFIHTEMKPAEVSSLKKHISEQGASVFNAVQSSSFPKYNTNFKSAFDKARGELGPNAIFEYNGNLYTTNHPGESSDDTQSALTAKLNNFNKSNLNTTTQRISQDDLLTEKTTYLEEESDIDFWEESGAWETIESNDDDDDGKFFDFGISLGINDKNNEPEPIIDFTPPRAPIRFESISNGRIRIEANLAGIPIYINGIYVGDTPLYDAVSVEPGWHQVSSFTPVYKQMIETGYHSFLGDDPIVINNESFGAQTIFVEPGKVADVTLKFNRIGNMPKKLKDLYGGWLVGLPILISFIFFLISP